MAPGIIDDAIIWLTNLIAEIIFKINEFLVALWTWVVEMLDALIVGLWDILSGIFVVIQEGLASLFASIEETLTNIVDAVYAFLEKAWGAIYEATIGVLDTITTYAADLRAVLEAFIAEALDDVAGWIQAAAEWVRKIVDEGIRGVRTIVARATEALLTVVDPILQWVGQAIASVTTTISAAWEMLVIGAESIIVSINERLVGLRDAFADAAVEIVGSISGLAEDQLGPIRDSVKEFVETYLPGDDPGATQRAVAAMEGIHTSPQSMATYREWWAGEWRRTAQGGTMRKAIFFGAFLLMSMLPTIMGISNILSQVTLQEYAANFPYQILSPADATAAWRRGLITQGEAISEIRRAGFNERKAGFVSELTSLVPAEQDLVRMKWRGIVHDSDFDKALQHQGFDEPWRARIAEAAKLIPAVPDLIQMAVRDVWNAEAVALGKLMELFPKELGEWTEKQGLSPDWALKYWAAHWRLPSILQAFEMRHRDVIDDSALDTLLQALDVAPGWRQPLKDIAFHPYTRVDIRRMHRIGVLDEDEVHRGYLDLGYDEDKARGLTEFTKVLNEPKGIEDDAELGHLSRTAVLGFYEDGVLSRQRAAELLVTAGHTPEAAQLYLNASDADEERSDRKTETALIIELAEAGSLGWDEAEDKLRGLGLETREVERAVTKLLRARQRKTKLPSKGDADAFFVAHLLTKDEYEDLLGRIGYSPKWTRMYLQIAEVKRGKG